MVIRLKASGHFDTNIKAENMNCSVEIVRGGNAYGLVCMVNQKEHNYAALYLTKDDFRRLRDILQEVDLDYEELKTHGGKRRVIGEQLSSDEEREHDSALLAEIHGPKRKGETFYDYDKRRREASERAMR